MLELLQTPLFAQLSPSSQPNESYCSESHFHICCSTLGFRRRISAQIQPRSARLCDGLAVTGNMLKGRTKKGAYIAPLRRGLPPGQCVHARSRVRSVQNRTQRLESGRKSSAATYEDQNTEDLLLSCSTFNVLAPIYKRLGGRNDARESDFPDQWRHRNLRIMDQLLDRGSAIICLQELWLSNPELVSMYDSALHAQGYETFKLPRPNGRGDGLLTAVRTDKLEVVQEESLLFNDGGDRVAQFLWLRSRAGCCMPKSSSRGSSCACELQQQGRLGNGCLDPCREVIVINTHLLFPHNMASSFIRLRQVFKILEHLDSFKAKHNLCPVPAIICGDLNGTKRGQVYSLLRSQGFVSSYDIANNYPDSDERWVSHKDHHGVVCGVDYIWLWNPSERASQLALDWKAAVFKYLKLRLEEAGCLDEQQAFNFLCHVDGADTSASAASDGEVITLSSMESAVNRIGKELALTKGELTELLASADVAGKGKVSFQDFQALLRRCMHATDLLEAGTCSRAAHESSCGAHLSGLGIADATLFPPEMKDGVWPSNYTLSDHALLTAVFSQAVTEAS